MERIIDATRFGLPKSTMIEEIEKGRYAIVITRKSRIIMKDGIKLLAKADQIKAREPAAAICLKTSTPICSKTKKFLEDHHMSIITM